MPVLHSLPALPAITTRPTVQTAIYDTIQTVILMLTSDPTTKLSSN
jgi:hypothetical protein